MRNFRLFSLTLLLTACSGDQAVTYTGEMVPQAGTCEARAPAMLVRRGRYIQFTPREGVLVLSGQVSPDGIIRSSLDTQGADRKPYHLVLDASLLNRAIQGNYVTPRCRYAITLKQNG